MMQAYRYVARSQTGMRIEGTISATEQVGVIDHLRARGLIAIEVSLQKNTFVRWLRDGKIGGRSASLLLFYRSLGILIHAGVPLRRALDIVGEQIDDPLVHEAIAAMASSVESGRSLADAMALQYPLFPALAVALIRAAEQSAQLSETLERYAAMVERQRSLTRKLFSSMAYPVFVLTCALGLLTTLLVSILPTLASLFKQMNVEMPPLMAAGLEIQAFLARNGLAVGIVLVNLFAAGTYAGLRFCRALELDRLRLKLPLFGRLLRCTVVARWARLLGSLLYAGITIVDAIEATLPALGSPVYVQEITRVGNGLQDGGTLAEGLKASPWFESLAVHLVAIGEETGRLDDNLSRLADVYERDVIEDLATLVALIEPLIIVIVGIVVGAVVLAIFVPLYSLIGGVK